MSWRPYSRSTCLRAVEWARSSPWYHSQRCRHSTFQIRSSQPSIASILSTDTQEPPQVITAVGFVRTVRNQKRFSFLEIGDGSSVRSLQAIADPSLARTLGTGTSIAATGRWRPCPTGKEQSAELEVDEIVVLGNVDPETYPLQKKYHSPEYLRSIPHLRLRTTLNALVARFRSESEFLLTQYFRDHAFVRVQPPLITSTDCEGGGEVFAVSEASRPTESEDGTNKALENAHDHFFREPKFLTVSSQLHLEALIHEHAKVWTLSPTFRAEKSDTPRHVSEFWMLEAEMWTEHLDDLMDTIEDSLAYTVRNLLQSGLCEQLMYVKRKAASPEPAHDHEIEGLQERWHGFLRRPWPRMTYSEAIVRLQKASADSEVVFQHPPAWDQGLSFEHEKWIAASVGQGSPLFVTDYPTHVKPFYMLPSSDKTVACFDLLLPNGDEVVGGSLREHRLENLTSAMTDRRILSSIPAHASHAQTSNQGGTDVSGGLDWYLDLRRFGSVPHGGFGLGFDRLLGYLSGINNVKDVISWPRYFGRCEG